MKHVHSTLLEVSHYIIYDKALGTSHQKVYLAYDLHSHKLCVAKIFEKFKLTKLGKENYYRSTAIHDFLTERKSKGIVRLLDHFDDKKNFYHILEYIPGGDLVTFLEMNGPLTEKKTWSVFRHILNIIKCLHQMNVVHLDIKPDNLLIEMNEKKDITNVLLTDFEFSEWVTDERMLSKRCGSPSYIAPEMIMFPEYDGKKSELWNSGIVLYVLLCGHFPFSHPDIEGLFDLITDSPVTLPECYCLSDEVKDLIQKLLSKDPLDRITLEEVFNHPWFSLYPSEEKDEIDNMYTPCVS